MGVVFTSLFALGVILIQLWGPRAHLDADCVLYGDILYTWDRRVLLLGHYVPRALLSLIPAAILTLGFIALLWKELKIVYQIGVLKLHDHIPIVKDDTADYKTSLIEVIRGDSSAHLHLLLSIGAILAPLKPVVYFEYGQHSMNCRPSKSCWPSKGCRLFFYPQRCFCIIVALIQLRLPLRLIEDNRNPSLESYCKCPPTVVDIALATYQHIEEVREF
jgi:hypothetical protein